MRCEVEMKKVLFIFDRVAHYHRDLFTTLERILPEQGMELHLLSGAAPESAKGRTGLRETIVRYEHKFQFREVRVASYTLRLAVGVTAQIRKIKPDVVLCLGHVGNATHWKITKLKEELGFRLIAWQCGYEYNPGRAKAFVLRRFVPRFDHHLAYHSNARDYALAHGARPDQVTLIHNTINEARITPMSKAVARQFVIQRHPEIGARRILLFVGAVLAEKRIEIILGALDRLRRPDVVFVLVGDGEHLPAILAACADRQDVVLAGSIIEDVGPYFDAAEVYLLPGTGGLGINEAMAHSLPIISGFADGSADDLVVDRQNGYRLRDGTEDELADRLAKIIDNPALAEEMGRTSREWITGKFAFTAFIGRIRTALLTIARPMNAALPARCTSPVLNSPIDVLDWELAIARIQQWAHNQDSRYVCICNVHSVVTATQDSIFSHVVHGADMATPDGAPVAWMLRKLGFAEQQRINGPDLMWKYCEQAARHDESIFLYGSSDETLAALQRRLREVFPSLKVAGAISPPFRPLSAEEDATDVARINASGAGTVWVSLGCPKQEKWMAAHRGRINAVMIGVGAAFDYHAGTIKRAPLWMQRYGLEWLHRLFSEPGRLWKRYLLTNSLFVLLALRQFLCRRKESTG